MIAQGVQFAAYVAKTDKRREQPKERSNASHKLMGQGKDPRAAVADEEFPMGFSIFHNGLSNTQPCRKVSRLRQKSRREWIKYRF